MVKILNKVAIIGAIIALIPVALPYIILNATIQATLETTIIYVFPWGLLSENAVVLNNIILLINFMIPVVGAPILAIYGSTRVLGGKTIIGVAGVLSLFGDVVWFILLGSLVGGVTTVDVTGVGLVDTTGQWSYGFFVAIVGGIALLISIFLHPRAEQIPLDKSIIEPYSLELEKPYETAMEDELKYCPYCGEKIPAESEFCPKCGTNLIGEKKDVVPTKKCPNCKETIPGIAEYCPKCGTEIKN